MGLSFLAPFLFAGLGLLVVPYVIHQIRRPEGEVQRFSTLMFLPKETHAVIERRRIQHPWLMLLRMLALAALALAFTRPYWQAQAAVSPLESSTRHMIVLDTSYSMSVGDSFERAREAALRILESLEDNEAVGVVSFAEDARVVAALADGKDNHLLAQTALRNAEVSSGHTDYRRALHAAYRHASMNADPRMVIHVVSDFRQNGFIANEKSWKLPPSVELITYPIEPPSIVNVGISDLGTRQYSNGDLRVLVKVRNWSTEVLEDVAVYLEVEGVVVAENALTLQAGMSRQTSFRIEQQSGATIRGRVWLRDEGLRQDNERFFVQNIPQHYQILLVVSGERDQRWSSSRFAGEALSTSPDSIWDVKEVRHSEITSLFSNEKYTPDLVLLSDSSGLDAEGYAALQRYVESGGSLLMNTQCASPEEMDFLKRVGIRGELPEEQSMQLLSKIDLEHPIFQPFQASQYNDFSSIRFHRHTVLNVADSSDSLQVLARLDNGDPLIVEAGLGEGRIMLWAFLTQLDWTTLPKNPRFLPLMEETLQYLTKDNEIPTAYSVGETAPWESKSFSVPGNFSVSDDDSALSGVDYSVNVDANEGDGTPMSEDVFRLTFSNVGFSDASQRQSSAVYGALDDQGNIIQHEYGLYALVMVLCVLLVELFYMKSLTRETRDA